MRVTTGFKWFAFGVLIAVAGGVIAQSGYPTRARFNSVGIGTSPPAGNGGLSAAGTLEATAVEVNHASLPSVALVHGGTETNYARASSAAVELYAAAGNAARFQSNDGAHLLVLASAGDLTLDGVDLSATEGTFTINYVDGCSTTPTQAARWYKIGSQVTITTAAAAATCTADTTIFNSSVDLPAAIRPTTSNVYGPHVGANNNGASVTGMIEISTSGQVVVNRCGAVTGTCDGGTWTNSGNRAVDAWSVTYVQ